MDSTLPNTEATLRAAERLVLVDEEKGEAGMGLGVRVLEIRLDRAVKFLRPAVTADLQAEAISVRFWRWDEVSS